MEKEHSQKYTSNYNRFMSGEYCNRLDKEVLDMIMKTKGFLSIINDVKTPAEERNEILFQMLGKIGKYSTIGNNFACQCGKHIFIGEKTIINGSSDISRDSC